MGGTTMSQLGIQYVTPEYGVHYGKGYVGFTYNKDHIFAHGTAWFTRWDRMGDIRATHALLVTSENECIEAVGSGVRKADLQSYFDDPNCQIFFRKPLGLTEAIAGSLEEKAQPEIGKSYDNALIAGAAAAGSFLGHMINNITRGIAEDLLDKMLNDDNKWICSELVAYCMDSVPEYHDQGILRRPDATINPQELFEDETIFSAWKQSPDTEG